MQADATACAAAGGAADKRDAEPALGWGALGNLQGSQAQNSQQSGIEEQMSAESKLEKLRTAHAAEQQERERVANSNAERLLQELEQECAGRAAKAGNEKRRKQKRRGGAQDAVWGVGGTWMLDGHLRMSF